MDENRKPIYQFGAFRFDPAGRVLYRDGDVVPLTPKAADTLLILLERRGRVVEKGDLLKLVWPDTFVEEGGLARNISVLRKALGGYIETIPKRGYRFVAPADEVPRQPARRAAVIAAAALLAGALAYFAYSYRARETPAGFRATAIAVLPLKNLSGDPAQEYVSDGMTDELATVLAKTGVRVIASDSVRRLRPGTPLDEIGRQLKVEAVIQGTVLASGERVRINAQLVEVGTGRLIWAESYQRSLPDVLGLQAEVAAAIAREVATSLAPRRKPGLARPRPVVPAAYQACLRGRYFWNKRTEAGLRKAIESFNEAIASDATYAPAHAGLADSYALLGSNFYDAIRPREAMPRARQAALKALALDNQNAEARTSLGYVLMAYDWDLPAAEKEFQQALRSNPSYATAHHWYAHFLLAAGQPDRAAAAMKEAQRLDPLSLPVNVGVGWCSYFARRWDEAIGQYRKTLELEPEFALARQALAMALEQKGAHGEAIAEFQKAAALSGGSASTIASLGHAYALAGAKADAQLQLARLADLSRQKYVPAIYRALVYLGLGDKDSAAAWLTKAQAERSEYLIYYRLDPSFDSIRGDKRFVLSLTPPLP
jgi:TolB-like protein/DNA-binding winged helix-turn-helix (wHTH) protein/Tfp pilus assembly protein PilF